MPRLPAKRAAAPGMRRIERQRVQEGSFPPMGNRAQTTGCGGFAQQVKDWARGLGAAACPRYRAGTDQGLRDALWRYDRPPSRAFCR